MSKPKVTVVTVCYNSAPLLEKTIESVLSQDYDNVEYIIVDGGSTDGTAAILNALDPARVKWVSERDNGIYDAMNKGARLASGDWVIFMNAGDTFSTTGTVSRVFSRDFEPDTAVIYGDVEKLDSDGQRAVKRAEKPHNAHRMFFCHQSAFARREMLLLHPFDTVHRLSADFKFFKTLINEGRRFEQVDFPVALFDTGGVSNTRRSAGLLDNISVIRETDSLPTRLRLLPRLYIPYLLCKLRGK